LNSRRLLALAFITSLLLPMVPYGAAKSPPGYSERLSIYTAGTSAFWFLNFNGINATAPALIQAESTPGLSSYNLTAVKTTGWDSDFQVFGPQGYNLMKLPFIPDQGLFLRVRASSASGAGSIASVLDSYMGAAFVTVSNASGTFDFLSPSSFSLTVPGTLLKLLPQSASGFASLVNSASFISLSSPFVSLSGEKTPTGFHHRLTLGSIRAQGLVSGSIQLLSLFGTSPTSLQASRLANSSTIYLRSLDGLVSSTDKAQVKNNAANFSGAYTYSVGQGRKVKALNISVLQAPPVVVATRILDRGVLNQGDHLSVTLSAKNAGALPIQNFTVSDAWWKAYPSFFTLSSGNSSFTIPAVGPGAEESRTYVLRFNSTDKSEITIPTVTAGYRFQSGGVHYNGTAVFNQAEVLLGIVGPALSVIVQPSGGSGNPIGTPENFSLTVSNLGTGPALNVRAANTTKESLAQGSQPWVVSVPIKYANILQTNVSKFFTVSWQTPSGETRSLRSNWGTLFFSHSSMEIGFGRVAVNGTITPLSSTSMNLTLRYTTTNTGHAVVTTLWSSQAVPTGLPCGRVSGSNVTCSNGVVSLQYRSLPTGANRQASVSFLVGGNNFVLSPARFNVTTMGMTFSGESGGVPVPAGLLVSKTLTPNPLFQGMSATAAVAASNRGAFSFYNTTVSSSTDSFDRLPTPAPITQKFFGELKPGNSSNFSFSVIAGKSQSGTLKLAPLAVQLTFGGIKFTLSVPQGNATLYRPLQASLTTSPRTPVEGNNFQALFSLRNPSPVQVSRVHFSVSVPRGLKVVSFSNLTYAGGNLTAEIPALGAGGSYLANATLKAESGIAIDFKGTLNFVYNGQQVNGVLTAQSATVKEDILTRYAFPIIIALLGVLAVGVVVRRRVAITSPSSPK